MSFGDFLAALFHDRRVAKARIEYETAMQPADEIVIDPQIENEVQAADEMKRDTDQVIADLEKVIIGRWTEANMEANAAGAREDWSGSNAAWVGWAKEATASLMTIELKAARWDSMLTLPSTEKRFAQSILDIARIYREGAEMMLAGDVNAGLDHCDQGAAVFLAFRDWARSLPGFVPTSR